MTIKAADELRSISVLGRKGGVGKTRISHLLGWGFGMAGYNVVVIMTDVRDKMPAERVEGRPYYVRGIQHDLSGRAEENESVRFDKSIKLITQTISDMRRIKNSVIIYDGGANRKYMDNALAALSDMVLLPVGTSEEDISVARKDYDQIRDFLAAERNVLEAAGKSTPYNPILAYIRNRWPGDRRREDTLFRRQHIRDFEEKDKSRILDVTITDLLSSMDIAGDEPECSRQVEIVYNELADYLGSILGIRPPESVSRAA